MNVFVLRQGDGAESQRPAHGIELLELCQFRIARPRRIVIVPDMPKTRSGKIMRRVLAAISNNEDAGDISTLANPEIVDEIRKMKS